jgi:hypothetical protein
MWHYGRNWMKIKSNLISTFGKQKMEGKINCLIKLLHTYVCDEGLIDSIAEQVDIA